jgi:uncharacterized protein YndB with AHSA1/START domain
VPEAIRQGDIPGVQLRRRVALSRPAAVVWNCLLRAELVERWLCAAAHMPVDAGGGFEWRGAEELGEECVEHGELLRSEPCRRLVLSLRQPGWPAQTRLELELAGDADDGCELSVLQHGFEHLPLSDSLTVWETYRDRWRGALTRLAGLVDAL